MVPVPATIKCTNMLSWITEYFWQQDCVLLVPQLPPSSSVYNKINKGVLCGKRGYELCEAETWLNTRTPLPGSSHKYRFTVIEKITCFLKLCYSTVFNFCATLTAVRMKCVCLCIKLYIMGWLQKRSDLPCEDLSTNHHYKFCLH